MNAIHIIKENQFDNTTWFIRIMNGISGAINPKKDTLYEVGEDELEKLPADTIILVIGFSNAFISSTLERCLSYGLRPLAVGINPNNLLQKISYVTVDRSLAMQENIASLIDAGAEHIALLGINSSVHTDMAYFEGFLKGVQECEKTDIDTDIFNSNHGIREAIKSFCRQAEKYDAVCCPNDYTAIYLLAELKKLNIRVPEDLSVTGFGNLDIAQYTDPPLSTIDMSFEEVGKQAILLYKLLAAGDSVSTIACIVQHKRVYRATTQKSIRETLVAARSGLDCTPIVDTSYEDHLRPIWFLANTYNNMDSTDREIIRGIVQGKIYAEIADMCYISDSTLRYRLNKIYASTKVKNKEELKSLINTYFPNFH